MSKEDTGTILECVGKDTGKNVAPEDLQNERNTEPYYPVIHWVPFVSHIPCTMDARFPANIASIIFRIKFLLQYKPDLIVMTTKSEITALFYA